MTAPKVIKVKSGSIFEDKESYSRLVAVDNWIFVSNTAGRNYKTREMSTDAVEQARQCFANIEGALASVNASLADVVRSRDHPVPGRRAGRHGLRGREIPWRRSIQHRDLRRSRAGFQGRDRGDGVQGRRRDRREYLKISL